MHGGYLALCFNTHWISALYIKLDIKVHHMISIETIQGLLFLMPNFLIGFMSSIDLIFSSIMIVLKTFPFKVMKPHAILTNLLLYYYQVFYPSGFIYLDFILGCEFTVI